MTDYHTFIINESKGSLKFYNGPSFSNSYTKPQFTSAAGSLTGVSFDTQQISFTVAVYAVTAAEYRALMHLFNPYTIGNLSFDFQPDWRYVVKLAKVGDSTRYIVGYDNEGNDLYYTELSLTFELQGDPVAIKYSECDYIVDATLSTEQKIFFHKANVSTYDSSDLDTPFLLTFQLIPSENIATLTGTLVTTNGQQSHELSLFNLGLTNLTLKETYTFEYNSQTGDLCLLNGDERKVITLLTTYTSGKRIINALSSNRALLPGAFNGGDWSQLYISLKLTGCTIKLDQMLGCGINCYARTNLI